MVARLGKRRRFLPGVACGVVDLVRRHGESVVDAAAADGVDLPIERRHGDRAARLGKRCQLAPGVLGGVVFEHLVLRPAVNRACKAANADDLVAENRDADVVEAARHRRASAPRIGRRIVFLHHGDGAAFGRRGLVAADHVELAPERGHADFESWRRQRRLRHPSTGHFLCSHAQRGHCDGDAYHGESDLAHVVSPNQAPGSCSRG